MKIGSEYDVGTCYKAIHKHMYNWTIMGLTSDKGLINETINNTSMQKSTIVMAFRVPHTAYII